MAAVAVRQAKPRERDYKLSDSFGVYLHMRASGGRTRRFKYRIGVKEKVLMIGPYPEISFAEARDRRDEARRLLRENGDPGIAKRKARAITIARSKQTFEEVARRWHDSQLECWSEAHADTVIESLERDIFGQIGNLPIPEIDAPLVLATLRVVKKRRAVETAHRLRQRMSAVFVRAISEGIGTADPAATVAGALRPVRRLDLAVSGHCDPLLPARLFHVFEIAVAAAFLGASVSNPTRCAPSPIGWSQPGSTVSPGRT